MELTSDEHWLGDFNEQLRILAAETGKDFGLIVRQNARLLAINLAIQTQPWAGGEGNFKSDAPTYTGLEDRKLGESAVRRDIARVYSSIERVYEQIRRQAKDDKAARKFYAAAINGQIERAQRILRSFRIFDRGAVLRKFDAGDAHQRRRNRRGRVGSRYAEMVVTNPKALATYARKIERRVGMAKGGWAACAQALGGTRGLPQWVTRHKSRGGSVSDRSASDRDPYVALTNSVPWIEQVLNAAGMKSAAAIQQEKMEKRIAIVIAYNARKRGFLATP